MAGSPKIDPSPWTHRYVDLPEVRLHVTEAGPPEGPLVILLHGFPEFWFGWNRLIGPLAESGFRVVAPDQRGYNLSDKPRSLGAYRLDRLAGDIVRLIDAAGREWAYIVGHDWGGAVAWWLGANAPSRLRGLAVLNMPHPRVFLRRLRNSSAQRRMSRYMLFFQLPWIPERRLASRDWAVGVRALRGTSRAGTFDDAEIIEYRKAWERPGGVRGMFQWYRAGLRRRAPWTHERVTVPTRIIWGMRDRFLEPQMIDDSLEMCDEGRAVRIPDASHWVHREEPELVRRSLVEFFDSTGVDP